MYGHVKSCILERRCTVPHVPCLTPIGYCFGSLWRLLLYPVQGLCKRSDHEFTEGSLTHLTELPASTEQRADGSSMPSVIVNHASLNYRIVNLVHPLSILHRGPVDDFQPVSALPLLRWYGGTRPCLLQFRDTSIYKLQAKTSVYTNCDCDVWHTSTLLRLATVQSSLSMLIQYCHATV